MAAAAGALFATIDKAKLGKIEAEINGDAEFKASAATVDNVCFGICAPNSSDKLLFGIKQGKVTVRDGPPAGDDWTPQFDLNAQAEHWQEVFAPVPKRPFQSYWGMLRLLGQSSGVEVTGDKQAFTKHARLWRIVLDRVRDALHPPPAATSTVAEEYTPDDERDDDSIVGHYTWLTLSPVGKCKIFYETSGQGEQDLLFLHTAGADSRQYHSLMLNPALQRRCTMYAFDLPGHGRSFPGTHQYPQSYANSEEFYISAIHQMIVKLKLKRVIVSGASMGGQVCLAVALRASSQEMDVRGVIACEACDYLPSQQASTIYSLQGDESILNAERVCGMISPTSPAIYKRLNWWLYSAQASRIFPGDLKFYFDGWDGRDRMHQIDTDVCPVYMLTGEYDYSCSPDTSRATADKIKGAVFEEMKGLGHFPFSEDPERFLPYFVKALDHITTSNR
ncbi:uncharacterized protein Z520_03900 [Fonsecaea multimorphosa CBS 102226]|uniref:AB hydrolase-1 domain-containing protein n=1 Tax=Fonsecaea multimorphosa CBS 102226 TaxID=1442371 RepID=A0A0D2KAM6_9EURO|nr:uncharacterized protein Z520_03900 [Fonsecaea multimorphosa CBS 102226]KIY00215.1 hypothetical protein Z520_03900 [Fonsecaea multimorphosa CBS 102226]OAL27408.1 hypothetical protein AYO22_03683 [Fonsecaea multimorphosa]